MVQRYTSYHYDFVCVSDHDIPGVVTIPVDSSKYPPLWYKLYLLDDPTINQYEHKVFFDLDVVIHNSIDWCFTHSPKGLSVLRSVWKSDAIAAMPGDTGINSSIMIWRDARYVWDIFLCNDEFFTQKYKGIDRFLWNEPVKWSEVPRDEVYSYREGASIEDSERMLFRPAYSVCIYNQTPKPDESLHREPARSYWI
jgi:hypothetical protein